MGFNHFWNFIRDGDSGDIGVERDFNWVADKKVSNKPWIIIDWNNVIMHTAVDCGGHLALLERRLELFFGALARCGARICVIRDGNSHSEERTVVKLKRQHEDLVESTVDVKGVLTQETRDSMDSTELTTAVAFALAKKVFEVYFAGKTSKDTDNISKKVMYIFRTAVGEADPEIRNFARARSLQGKRVMIMSNDASLLLGVGPSINLAITRIDSITLKKRTTDDLPISADNVLLRGMIYPMTTFLNKLTEKSNLILSRPSDLTTVSGVTDDMIPWIAALLGGETANIRLGQYDDPRSIIWYVKDFLLDRDGPRRTQFDNKGKQVLDLLVATVLVRAWKDHNMGRATMEFSDCVSAIRSNAAYIIRSQPPPQQRGGGGRGRGRGRRPPAPPPQPLYSLHSWTQNSTDLRFPASNLLNRYERVTSANIQAVAGNPFQANFQGRRSWYAIKITRMFADGTVGVIYSERNPVEDGCPGGLANEGVVRAMGAEVNNRRLASLDQGPRTPTSHQVKWGLWTYCEPIAEDSEALLSPLESLAVQIDFVKDRVSTELYGAAAGDWEQQIEALQHDGGGSVVESFNIYLRSLLVVTSSSDGKEEEEVEGEDKEEEEEVAAVILLTSKLSLSPSSLLVENDLPPIYTIADLNDNFVRTQKPIPSNGVIISSPPSATTRATTATAAGVKFGLKFRSCDRDDPLDRHRGYCRGDVENMYNNKSVVLPPPPPAGGGVVGVAGAGNLLNLHNRALYLDSIIISLQHHSTWKDGCGSSTASADSANEYAAAVLFENLGLAAAPPVTAVYSAPHQKFRDQIEVACAAISACWEKLPCSKEDRDFLVSVNPAKDTAKVLFAVVYSFTALLAPSVKESMVQLGELSDIITTVTTALLLAPLFAIHALALPAADGSPRSPSSSEQQQQINPLSTVTDYSNQVSLLSRRLVLPGGTRASSRVANLLENVLSLVLNLLGDVRAYDTVDSGEKKSVPEEEVEEKEEERRTFSERKSAQASAEWISHCRWFNVSGVQHVVALRERGESVRSCCVAVDSVLQLGMSTAGEVVMEDGGGGGVVGDDEMLGGGFGGFIPAADDTVAAVLASLEGFVV